MHFETSTRITLKNKYNGLYNIQRPFKKNQLKKLDGLKSVLLKINFLSEADETNFYNYFS